MAHRMSRSAYIFHVETVRACRGEMLAKFRLDGIVRDQLRIVPASLVSIRFSKLEP